MAVRVGRRDDRRACEVNDFLALTNLQPPLWRALILFVTAFTSFLLLSVAIECGIVVVGACARAVKHGGVK